MTSKKQGGLLKLVNCSSQYFSKKILSCVSLCHKDFKKHLLIKVSIKSSSECIFRKLKQHQHKIITKTEISLEITLNVFKCLMVSLASLKFLLLQQYLFWLFQLASSLSVNLLWCQECTFSCAPRKILLLHSSS